MAIREGILSQCLNDLEGGASVEECLARHPQWRDELESPLRIAQQLRSAPKVTPSPTFRGEARARMLSLIQTSGQVVPHEKAPIREVLSRRVWSLYRALSVPRRLSVPAVAALLLVISMAIGGGVVYASGSSLPGDFLYPVKLTTERMRLALSPTEMGDASLHISFAGERLGEAVRASEMGDGDKLGPLMIQYVGEMEAATGILEGQLARGHDATLLAHLFQTDLARHESALDRVDASVTGEARSAIQRARIASEAVREGTLPGAATAAPSVVPRHAPGVVPTGTPTPTLTPSPTATPEPGPKPEATDTPDPTEVPESTETPDPPDDDEPSDEGDNPDDESDDGPDDEDDESDDESDDEPGDDDDEPDDEPDDESDDELDDDESREED
jgi:hypothetical protein